MKLFVGRLTTSILSFSFSFLLFLYLCRKKIGGMCLISVHNNFVGFCRRHRRIQILLLPSIDESVWWLLASRVHQLQFHQQGEMIRWYVRMWTTNDFVIPQPIIGNGSEQAKRHHTGFCIEYIIDNTLKIESIIRMGHNVLAICRC